MAVVDSDFLRDNDLLQRVWAGLGEPSCYLTGGFLRDHLLGRHSTDIDLSVPGDVDQIAGHAHRLADSLGTRTHQLGQPPRCVWRIETPQVKVELWPMGELTLNRDIQRRDFSCNALMWGVPRGPLIDRVDGVVDIERRTLRALSRENLRRDPIRLLRGPRFLSTLEGFELEERTADWIRELAPQLDRAPRERIGQELALLIYGAFPSKGLQAALELGLVDWAAPGGPPADVDWLGRNLAAADRLADAEKHPIPASLEEAGHAARLALLLRAWRAPRAPDIAEYAWNRQDRRLAAQAAALLDRAVTAVQGPVIERKELIYASGSSFPVLIALGSALEPGSRAAVDRWRRWWRQWERSGTRLMDPPALLTADEVIEIVGTDTGPGLGTALRGLELAQARGEVRSASGARRWLARLAADSAD
jgi:tRNA nucleotidyltransferase (CCA-adding enzyme)